LTLEQIARRLDVAYSTVQRWTQQNSRPTARMRQRIHDLYQAEQPDNASAVSRDAIGAAVDQQPSDGPREFIGRVRELAELRQIWPACQILTLTGPGGTGKSRLAAELQRRSPGRLLVAADFGTVGNPVLAVSALARMLGIRPRSGVDERDAIAAMLREQRGVLVLDTCERVTEPLRALLDYVLPTAPNVVVLATSLRPLGVRGETTWRVPGLALCTGTAESPADDSGEGPAQPDAVRFFLARAREHARSFGSDGAAPAGVLEICRRLDGIPLALGLAAGHVAVYSPATMLRHWEALLAAVQDPAAEHQRQRSLAATIEWSAALLSDSDQELARHLAILVGSVTAEDIAAAMPNWTFADVLAGIRRLCELSWLEFSPVAGPGSYRMLDPLRAWGLASLAGSGRSAGARLRHARYFADVCRNAEADHFRADLGNWPARLEQAAGNIQAALTTCVTEERELGAQLAARLLNWWRPSGRLADGDHWYRRLATSATPEPHRARVTCAEALIAVDIGDYDRAGHQARRALDALQRQGDELWAGRALTALSSVAKYRGRPDDALGYLERALAHQQRNGDQHEIAVALNNLGSLAHDLGSFAKAERYYRLSLDAKRHAGDRRSIALTMTNLADVLTQSGHHREGHQMLDDAMYIVSEIPDEFLAAFVNINLGENLLRSNDVASAQSAFGSALGYATGHGAARFKALAACGLGRALCAQHIYAEGVPLLEESARTARLMGDEMLISQAQAALDALPPEAFLPVSPLSRRQAEVLRLAAGDLTIAQIARRLYITESTVEKHLDKIYKALGVHSRTSAIIRAQELKILPLA
jgi:predicted ATPase/DNA-binding CsgD family transcriptional regulator